MGASPAPNPHLIKCHPELLVAYFFSGPSGVDLYPGLSGSGFPAFWFLFEGGVLFGLFPGGPGLNFDTGMD